jgi:hypothetical protein
VTDEVVPVTALSVDAVRELFGDDVANGAERCLDDTQEIAVFNPGSEVSVVGVGR